MNPAFESSLRIREAELLSCFKGIDVDVRSPSLLSVRIQIDEAAADTSREANASYTVPLKCFVEKNIQFHRREQWPEKVLYILEGIWSAQKRRSPTYFAPQMHVPNQLVGAPKGTNVRLECFVEAHPKAITYWEFNDAMVMNTSRITTQTLENHYKIHMILDIRDLDDGDFGMYKCISKNSIAETDGSITLNKTPRPTTPPQMKQSRPDTYDADGDIHYRSRGRPGRKEHYNRQDPQQGRRRPQDLDGIKEEREEEERREMEEEPEENAGARAAETGARLQQRPTERAGHQGHSHASERRRRGDPERPPPLGQRARRPRVSLVSSTLTAC
ncbi:uncharacterized protein LOC125044878 [Penaeus chinensis]|uniref:uncharacterized protein LOC125044878 n=1 Tax=Penaeus chinensis TaxID=139456 RepID=UPI001FB599F8|nr:uncharacterized protein LOC125044878 [Penaeus chinensis]